MGHLFRMLDSPDMCLMISEHSLQIHKCLHGKQIVFFGRE